MNNETNRLHPDTVEEMLADATSRKIETAEFNKLQLELKRQGLLSRLRPLLARMERWQIEIAEAGDSDMSPQGGARNESQAEIMRLQRELSDEWREKGDDIATIETRLQAADVRIRSLEALIPGNGALN